EQGCSANRRAGRLLTLDTDSCAAADFDCCSLPAPHPLAQKIEQCQFQRAVRSEATVGNTQLLTGRLHGLVVGVELLQVFLPRGDRVDEQVAVGLDIVKHDGFLETKGQFRRVEDVKQQDFMATSGQRDE